MVFSLIIYTLLYERSFQRRTAANSRLFAFFVNSEPGLRGDYEHRLALVGTKIRTTMATLRPDRPASRLGRAGQFRPESVFAKEFLQAAAQTERARG